MRIVILFLVAITGLFNAEVIATVQVPKIGVMQVQSGHEKTQSGSGGSESPLPRENTLVPLTVNQKKVTIDGFVERTNKNVQEMNNGMKPENAPSEAMGTHYTKYNDALSKFVNDGFLKFENGQYKSTEHCMKEFSSCKTGLGSIMNNYSNWSRANDANNKARGVTK